MKKMIPILALVALSLTGCYAPQAETPTDASKANTTSSDYTIEYVQVEDKTIRCLWLYRDSQSGSMSCDWDNPGVE